MSMIVEAITAHWGERCPEADPGCGCCQAWAEFDALVGALGEARSGLLAFTGGADGACSETVARIDAALGSVMGGF